jgi:PASTA domain
MTTPSNTAISVEEFTHRVSAAFTDLDESVRNRVISDLDTHLRELSDRLESLGTPEEYARELREALELPVAVAGIAASHAVRWWRRGWLVALAAAGTALVIAVALIAIFSIGSSTSPAQVEVPAATTAAVTFLPLPNVVGLDLAQARAVLESAGLQVEVEMINSATAPSGTVVAQTPDFSAPVQAGTTVVLQVAS